MPRLIYIPSAVELTSGNVPLILYINQFSCLLIENCLIRRFVAGSNMGDDFQPVTTSYDFDAPLNEAGDPTEKYYKIRTLLGKV